MNDLNDSQTAKFNDIVAIRYSTRYDLLLGKPKSVVQIDEAKRNQLSKMRAPANNERAIKKIEILWPMSVRQRRRRSVHIL